LGATCERNREEGSKRGERKEDRREDGGDMQEERGWRRERVERVKRA
jgi:hypothetical protein